MTIKEIARLAGVSISTVSKIVNNKDQYINPETRARVLQIVKEYNYTPYGSVKNLSSSRTLLIGVLLNRMPASSQLTGGIMEAAQAHGYSVILLDSQDDPLLEFRHITTLCRTHVDGVIWKPVGEESLQYRHHFPEQNIPVCNISNDYIRPFYHIDFASLGYAMTQKLIDHRHTRIACLLNEGSRRSASVLDGYKRCLFDNQIPFDPRMQIFSDAPDCTRRIREIGASGVISSHYSPARALYAQLRKLHFDIPDDLSIVSLKSVFADQFSFTHISGIPIPHREFGRYVCEQLVAAMEKTDHVPEGYSFTPDTTFDSSESITIPPFLRTKRIIVVGSINTDFTFNVEHTPQSGRTTAILNSITAPGGKGVNQAIGAARLGRQVALIGEIGNDTYSPYIMSVLEKEHVTTQGIHKDMAEQTGAAYIYTEKDGNSAITIQAGANNRLLPKRIQSQQHLFKKAGYCLVSTEIPIETVIAAVEIARKNHARTIVKPATLKEIPEELYQKIDILVPNRKEASILCPGYAAPQEQAAFFLEKGVSTVIITLGEDGCYLRTADTEQYFPAGNFIAVDTTGGADAFISALAAYLTEGYSLEKSIRIATCAAGFCISRQGVVAGLVDSSTLEAYIKRIEPELL